MFDRVALLNLDKRQDRLGAFRAKIIEVPAFADFVRYRGVEGDKVTVPHFFTSGGGAWGCRQSHLRILEDAMMDGIETLVVLEDDVCFCADFQEKLYRFVASVPNDWQGLMLGGQNQVDPIPTQTPGVFRAVDTQRTHAYVVRGLESMRSLYQVWAKADRHIDHMSHHWQDKHPVYQPDGFFCGQDEGKSDISGRTSDARFWFSGTSPVPDTGFYLLDSPRDVAERVRLLGLHFGHHRHPVTGFDKGLQHLEQAGWPAEQLAQWGNTIAYEAAIRGDVPGIWHPSAPDPQTLGERLGRPMKVVRAATIEDAARAIRDIYPRYVASQILWCWRGTGAEKLYGLEYYGWHAGYHRDSVTGLNNAVRQYCENNNPSLLHNGIRQLTWEATKIRYGKPLLAHPDLDVTYIRDIAGNTNVRELFGDTVTEVLHSFTHTMSGLTELL